MCAYRVRSVYFYTSWLILIYGSVPFSQELGFFSAPHLSHRNNPGRCTSGDTCSFQRPHLINLLNRKTLVYKFSVSSAQIILTRTLFFC